MNKQLIIIGIIALLVCVGLSGCNEQSITVQNKSPTLTIDSNVTEGYSPLFVHFNCTVNDPDGFIISYLWDFGDGNFSTEANPNHAFQEKGKKYQVILTVTDNKGANTSKGIEITIFSNNPPTVSIQASIEKGSLPLSVSFTSIGIDVDGNITNYYWKFGDSESSNEQNPTHIFKNFGNYKIVLTVTDNDGASNKDDVLVEVTIPIVTDQELKLIEWIGEKINVLAPLCSNVWRSVTILSTYNLDEDAKELSELAEQYQEDINQFSDLSKPFVTIKNKFKTVLKNYITVGDTAYYIWYEIDNYGYYDNNVLELFIEDFSEDMDVLAKSINDVTEIISFIEK